MEMEDHTHHHHHHQYGIADLRQLMNGGGGRSHFLPTTIPPHHATDIFPGGPRNLTPPVQQQQQQNQYELMMMSGRHQVTEMVPRGLPEFRSESGCVGTTALNGVPAASGFDVETVGDGGSGRWPRQETLILLEIRSRLDSKFKEANQKGPLWDEVSRIMSEEHGYQRSGKKCREKFENLYKYYKKTKEGKAGRQDGKHYRFFRQLEALYGETSTVATAPETHYPGNYSLRFHNSNSSLTAQANQEAYQSDQKNCDSLSFSNSSGFESSSSDDNGISTDGMKENEYGGDKRRKRRGGRSWKLKIKEFIDSQMRKLMEKQEAWLEKLMKTLDQKEKERMLREEEWRKQEAARLEREHRFWAKERAWIEARDAALMEALHKLTGREVRALSPEALMAAKLQNHGENPNEDGSEILNNIAAKGPEAWHESELTRLIQLRTSMDSRFQQSGCTAEVLWEEIAAKMRSCFGYDRSALMCKDKWESINDYMRKSRQSSKKRKDNISTISGCFIQNEPSLFSQGGAYSEINEQGPENARLPTNDGSSPSSSNNNVVNDSCFRFLMGEGETLWENYGLKLNKGADENQ